MVNVITRTSLQKSVHKNEVALFRSDKLLGGQGPSSPPPPLNGGSWTQQLPSRDSGKAQSRVMPVRGGSRADLSSRTRAEESRSSSAAVTATIHPMAHWLSGDPLSDCSSRESTCCCSLFEALVESVIPSSTSPLACEKFRQRYTLEEELGRGSSGIIRLCTDKLTGEKLACKSIEKRKQSDGKQAHREVSIMKQVSGGHPSIISLRGAYSTSRAVHLVMELCTGGSLLRTLRDKRSPFTESQAANMLKCLVESIQFCHSKGIVHRDITLANVLISDHRSSSIKLADFGLAAQLKPGERLSQLVGTIFYLAPEVLLGDYGQEVDVWSAGVVLYALLSGGELPFVGNTTKSIFSAILSREPSFSSAAWTKVSPSAKDLIRGMLRRAPAERLTAKQILEHEWLVQQTTGLSATEEQDLQKKGPTSFDKDPEEYSDGSFWSMPTMKHVPVSVYSLPRFGKDILVALKLLLSVFFLRIKYG